MSHFYGTLNNGKAESTRCGHKPFGLSASAKGRDLGGTVTMRYNKELDIDIVTFYTTQANGRQGAKVASFAVTDGKLTILETNYPELLV